jgi:hypothetical protein
MRGPGDLSPIVRAIEFCTQFDPAFPASIEGAAPEQIARLGQLMPRPMSGMLRGFLSRLGVRHAWLDFGTFSTNPGDLLELRAETLRMLPTRVELLAVTMREVEMDIFLIDGDGDTGGVAFHPILEDLDTDGFQRAELEWLAGSLPELICLQALNRHYSLRQPYRAAYSEREPRADSLQQCRAIGTALDFEPYWFSSAQAYVARRETLVLIARQAPERSMTLALVGAQPEDWENVSRTLERELALEPLGL